MFSQIIIISLSEGEQKKRNSMNFYHCCVQGPVWGLVPAVFSASTCAGFGHVKIGPAHAESSAGELEHLDLLAPAGPAVCYFPDVTSRQRAMYQIK